MICGTVNHTRVESARAEAIELQQQLALKVIREDRLDAVHYVAGVDVAYGEDNDELTAAVVILEAETKPTASPEP